MALSGTITGSIANGNYTLRISWTATQNVSANTSTVTAKLYLVQAASWSLNIGTRSTSYNSCTINGTKKTFSSPAINNGGGATTLLATITQSVPHNADGTKSVTIAGVFGIRATISGTYYASISASATVALDTIPRTSALTVSASAVTLGNPLTLTIARAASAFTHTLRYTIGAYSGTIASGVATSYTWTTPLTLCNALPSSTSGNLIVYCDTYNGGTKIGTTSKAVTASVPASVVPTITGCTLAEAASNIPDGWKYIAGLSKLKIAVTAAGAYGSTVSAYKINVNGATYAGREVTTGELTGSGTQYVSVQVTDSRGRQATKTYPYTVESYSRPTLQDYTVKRVDDSGADDDEGSNVFVSVSAIVSPAGDLNSGTLVLQYKATTDADWTTIATYDVTALYVEHTVQGISVDSSYEFVATLSDALYTSTATRDIQTATPTVDFKANGQGVALGKVSEYNAFECAMPAIFYDTIRVGGSNLTPLVAMTVHRNNTNQNLAATETYEQIKFTGATALGDGLSMNSNGGVVVGNGVTMVRISGQICFGAQVNGMKVVAVWVEGSNTHLARTQAYVTTANPQTIVFAPKYVNVTPGSVLSLRAYGQQGDVVYGGTMQTYFTVEAVG